MINVGAVAVSVSALAVSSWLAKNQFTVQRHGNHAAPILELLTEFRSLDFQRNYAFVRDELPTLPHDGGISGLDEEAQRKIYDIAYFFQLFATLAYLDIMDERLVSALLRRRYLEVWAALQPFVHRERELKGVTDEAILNVLESFVERIRTDPPGVRQQMLAGRLRR